MLRSQSENAMTLHARTSRFFSVVGLLALTLALLVPVAAGQSWQQLSPTGGPPPDSTSAEVGSPLNNRFVFWGGCGLTGCLHPTATWVLTNADGTAGTPQWAQLTVSGGTPAGRH